MADDAATALEGLCLANTSDTGFCNTETGSVSDSQAIEAVAVRTMQTSNGEAHLNRARVRRWVLKEIARLTKTLHGQSRRSDLGRINEHDLRCKKERLDDYLLTISGPECINLFEHMMTKLPQEIRDLIYSVIFQVTASEIRLFCATRSRDGSRVPFNPKTFGVCRKPGTADYKWFFDLFSAHDSILSDLVSALYTTQQIPLLSWVRPVEIFNKDYWHEDTDPYNIVHQVSMPFSFERRMDNLLNLEFRHHTSFTFYTWILGPLSHSQRWARAYETYSKDDILAGDQAFVFHVFSQLSSRGHKVTMDISEYSRETDTYQCTRLSFQDWIKNLG
ncbi:hypothetical protein E8E11_006047 [Didymella keratinophila]|nr:hypothetical protein E8E11_006047 [Didymella keratinophila]